MFKNLVKKRVSEEQLANGFVNGIIDLVDQGFPEVALIINEDAQFATRPNINADDSDKFLLVVIAGNLKMIPDYFQAYQDMRMVDHIYRKLAAALGLELDVLKRIIGQYQNFCSRMNHPSNNNLYAMSKGVFYKYDLNPYQQDYFKGMNSPNPIFLKKLNEIMSHFLWDWNAYLEKYRVTE